MLSSAVYGLGNFAIGVGRHGGKDATISQHTEEPLAAGVAPVGGDFQIAFQENKSSFLHAVARDSLQIEIPAPRAVRISHKGNRDAASVKTQTASVASPRF